MQTGVIGGSGNWDNFMKLANQARMRNTGLSGSAETPAAHIRTVNSQQTASAAMHQETAMVKPVISQSYTATHPATNVRILGGKFDAWA